jgi:hypothetical protein
MVKQRVFIPFSPNFHYAYIAIEFWPSRVKLDWLAWTLFQFPGRRSIKSHNTLEPHSM